MRTAASHVPYAASIGGPDDDYVRWLSEHVHRLRQPLIGWARRQGLSAEDARDSVQDAFLTFMQLPQARVMAELEDDSAKLVYVVLRHIIANRRRSLTRRSRLLSAYADEPVHAPPSSSEWLLARAESNAGLRGCVRRLAGLQRRLIELTLAEQHSNEQLAESCGISQNHARVLMHRARRQLRECLLAAGT